MTGDLDQDALDAAYDLVGRTGAAELDVGYLHDDVPTDQADWWATATYQGAKITVEHHAGPVEAVEALARRLLTGAQCARCRQPVRLDGDDRGPGCRWTRRGDRWEGSCQHYQQQDGGR